MHYALLPDYRAYWKGSRYVDEMRVMAPERKQDIRERAYAIWEQEGRPNGKEAEMGNEKIIGITNNGKILKSSRSGVVLRK